MSNRHSDQTPYQRFAEVSVRCLRASSQLQTVIALKSQKHTEARPGKVSHSQPPWNSAVAFSFLELHQLARAVERQLRVSAELPVRIRGSSDENTTRALEAAVKLAVKAGETVVSEAVISLDRWLGRALIVLGELELPQRLPRLPGKSEPKCVWCGHRTLRMFPLRGYIICIFPDCKDENGRKPRAQLEYSTFTRQFELVWQDSGVGLPVEDDAA